MGPGHERDGPRPLRRPGFTGTTRERPPVQVPARRSLMSRWIIALLVVTVTEGTDCPPGEVPWGRAGEGAER